MEKENQEIQKIDLSNIQLSDIYEEKEVPALPVEKENLEDETKTEIETPEEVVEHEEEETDTEEVPSEDEEEPQENLFKLLNDKTGYTIEGEFKEDIEGIASYAKELGSKIADESLGEIFAAYPDVEEYLNYRMLGGDPEKYLQTKNPVVDYRSIDIEDEEVQKNLIKTYLKNQGDYTDEEIQSKIEKYDVGGILEDEAKDVQKKFIKEQEKAKQNLIKEQEEAAEKRTQEIITYWKDMQESLFSAKELKGIALSDKQKNELFNYMAKPVDKDGRSKEMLADSQMKNEDRLALAYLKMINFDFNSLIVNKAKTLNSEKLIKTIKSSTEKVNNIKVVKEPITVTKIKNLQLKDFY